MPFPLEGQSWMLNIPGSQEIRGREDLRAPNIIAYSILAKCCCSGVLPGLSHFTLTNLRPWVTSTSPVLLTPAYQKNLYLYSSLSLGAHNFQLRITHPYPGSRRGLSKTSFLCSPQVSIASLALNLQFCYPNTASFSVPSCPPYVSETLMWIYPDYLFVLTSVITICTGCHPSPAPHQ